MRIISGKFKGHRLLSFKLDHIRPTTDRAKEIIFNKLMGEIDGAKVLDLFAGTGNLSLEAVSRGASLVVSVEKHPRSVQLIKDNKKKLGVADELKVIKKDVFRFIEDPLDPPYDIVFVDPPFTQKLAHDVMVKICESSLLSPNTIIIIEASKHERIDASYPGLKQTDVKDLGDKSVSFFVKE